MMIKPITEYARKGKRRKDSNKDLISRYEGHCIYAISECLSGCVKVGKSSQLYKRMQLYRTSSPAEIRLEGAVFLEDESKLWEVERETHRQLRDAGYHIRGEWFRVDLHTLRDMVAKSCEGASAKISSLIGGMRPPEVNEYSDYADRLPDFADSRHKYVRASTRPEPI